MIIVSACLMGENCKYNGGNNLNDRVVRYVESIIKNKGEKVLFVCPEVEGGLPVPRPPAEMIDGKVINKEGLDVTYEYEKGAEICYEKALQAGENISLAILKAKSPSCGRGKIYDGTFSKRQVEGDGCFANLLKSKGIRVITEEELNFIAINL